MAVIRSLKRIAASAMAALAMLAAGGVSAAGYPTEKQFRQALGDISGVLRAEGLALEVLDAQLEKLPLPLLAAGFNVDTHFCVVFFNTRPEDGLTQFFAAISERDLPLLLRAMSVHEIAHCVEQREAYVFKRFDKVLPDAYKENEMTLQGYSSLVKSGAMETWGEALADISSLLYLKQKGPEQWRELAGRISAMRRGLAHKWPTHDTSGWLDRMIEANPAIGDDSGLFEAAFRYRKQFRPK
jgi:hypothetical protein